MDSITVLMSTYNGEKYIQEQLDSILRQKNVNVELIVRDDGSTDNTIEILKEYSSRYSNMTFYCGVNLKPAKSFLELIQNNFTNDYYALSDQDDIWDDDKLITAIESLKKYDSKKPLLYFSNLRVVDQFNNFVRLSHNEGIEIDKYRSLIENSCTGCTAVYNKSAAILFSKYKPSYLSMHDSWIFMLCSFFGNVIYDSTPHMNYRQHGNNVVGTYTKRRTFNDYIKRFKRLFRKGFFPKEKNVKEFYKGYGELLNYDDRMVVKKVVFYKKNFKTRLSLFFDKSITAGNLERQIRFKILVLLGKI